MIDINVKDLIKNKNIPVIIAVLIIGIIIAKNTSQYQLRKINTLKARIEDIMERSGLIEGNKFLEKNIDLYRKAFAKKDASFYFDKLNEFMNVSALEVSSFEPLQEENKGAYFRIPYRLTISGSYHQIGKFLSQLESSTEIFKIENLNLSGDSSSDKLKVNLKVVALYLK